MSDIMWLLIAMLAVWSAIGAYIVSIAIRQRRVEERLERLRSRARPPTP